MVYNKCVDTLFNFFRKNSLLFIFLSPWVVDDIVTLLGQDASYWHGSLFINEGHPIYHYLLTLGVVPFLMGNIVELSIVYFFVKILPRPLNLMLSLGYGIGTVWSSSSWTFTILSKYFPGQEVNSFYWNCAYITLMAIITGYCVNVYIEQVVRKK